MASPVNTPTEQEQYAFRAQKQLGIVRGAPSYEIVPGLSSDVPTRVYLYSKDGSFFAYAIPGSVRIFASDGHKPLRELQIPNAIEINFSPLGTFISTWERVVKLEDGSQHKNLRVWSVATGQEVTSFTQKSQEGWDLQYTPTESHAVRQVGSDIQVFHPSDWEKGVVDKLRVEGLSSISLSPGRNPRWQFSSASARSVTASYLAWKTVTSPLKLQGAPASIRIYSLISLRGAPTCQKSFYKADQATLKWNALGTQVLLMTHTDVDKSNKSYYGETGLFLMSAAGNFDCRVTLDKEGPIHDFAWSPNSKEFGVVYGYLFWSNNSSDIPSKAVLFDQRVNVTADLGSQPFNFISFNPQGRLVALAGFGNLAGRIDIFDRRSLGKVCSIDAPNTSHCEWSPDGRYLLTATLSPRLRVDNGIKIWHCTGTLLHVHLIEELYQASWKRGLVEKAPPFPNLLPVPPSPSPTVLANASTMPTSNSQTCRAYRPPGARGLATPSIFKREDEGGVSHTPTNGASTPPRNGSASNVHPNNQYNNGGNKQNGVRQRHVPGAPPAAATSPDADARKGQGRRKRDKTRKDNEEGAEAQDNAPASTTVANERPANIAIRGAPVGSVEMDSPALETPVIDGLDPVAKKIRNLNKKLKAIEELKERVQKGDRLEATQLKKIEAEAEIKKELKGLGAAP
ncbi:hypothetical protein BS47DRAFT_1357866 [Hydnum rufescens UP504]|uniref:Eukaryotic translation initiation factor 2A n=1 Tax=Hydnum rufescens UP504 TaxID=1448309 RepID=A0A9P6BBP1_9AGAM|nr:hypothetical protein BS47DRAFT_1357866 [Hydnum rufescens UP504]